MNAVFGVRWNDNLKRVPLALMAVALLATSLLSQPGATDALSARAGEFISVIVREQSGAGSEPENLIESYGGTVEQELDIINGYAARVPQAALSRLEATPGVHSVTPNGRVHVLNHELGYDSKNDVGSPTNVQEVTGAREFWRRGYTGQGVDVAVIDTGVAPVTGLDDSGKVLDGPDLSFESQSDELRYLDSYGHGTHMAGIIAGKDTGANIPGGRDGDTSHYIGIAPDARIVNVKVAEASGATDVSQVIAAIDWVVQNRNRNGLNIRVLNLSFGTDGVQSYIVDPLAYAAEVAWHKGIVVVVAAGNDGYGSRKLNNPAYNPYVIAVGGNATNGTIDTKDDTIPEWSSTGDATRNPDIVAPGKSVISYRVPNSYIDQNYPEGLVGTRFFRGSGTSQAAAVVSGAAALIVSQRPSITPDQVKGLMIASAAKLPVADATAQGNGELNLKTARDMPTPLYAQVWPRSTGTGSLELARGTSH
ncbi:MAG: S8 family serine peptidase, partial [Actinomycetota bacterium]